MEELLSRFVWPKYGRKSFVALLCKGVEVIGDLLTPLIIARMIDLGIHGANMYDIICYGILLVVIAIVGFSFTLVCQKIASIVSQRTGTDLRNELFKKIQELSSADISALGTDTLVTRLINDVNQVQVTVALGIRQLVRWPILAAGSIIATLMLDAQLGMVFLLATVLVAAIFFFVARKSTSLFTELQKRLDTVSLYMRQMLSGIRVIRAFRHESEEKEQFSEAVLAQTETATDAANYSALLNPATFLVMYLGIAVTLWLAAPQITAGTLSQGTVVALVSYMTSALLAIGYVANLVIIITRGTASATRMMEVLNTKPTLTDEGNRQINLTESDFTGTAVAFKDASLVYDGGGEPALSSINLTLQAGQTLGIIGGTGSGKSSFAALIPRLFDTETGAVSVFGHDVKTYTFEQLRSLIGYVPQHTSLVSGTIRTNLCWKNPDATDEELWSALEVAQAADFVREKPDQLDSIVERGGKNFSG
ncbi:MAG: ABC transporter ATP-binding protein, partial [Lancefieldella parvula]|nr:ABC transporter ATP-binding protein [Lancefieldella parvula]